MVELCLNALMQVAGQLQELVLLIGFGFELV